MQGDKHFILAFAVLLAGVLFSSQLPFPGTAHVNQIEQGEALWHGVHVGNVTHMPISPLAQAYIYAHSSTVARSAVILVLKASVVVLTFSLAYLLGGSAAALVAVVPLLLVSQVWPGDGPGYFNQFLYAIFMLTVANALAWRETGDPLIKNLCLGVAVGASLLCQSPLLFFPPLITLMDFLSVRRAHGAVSLWKIIVPLCVVPYIFLVPWISLQWSARGRVILTEPGQANVNIMLGALGATSGVNRHWGQWQIEGAADNLSEKNMAVWAVKVILRRPARYVRAVAARAWHVFGLHPVLFLAAFLFLWRGRGARKSLSMAALVVYFMMIHCALYVERRYFFPLWPILCALAAGLVRPLGGPDAWKCRLGNGFSSIVVSAALLAVCSTAIAASWFMARTTHVLRRIAPAQGSDRIDLELSSHPDDAWLLSQRALIAMREGRFSAAVSDLSKAASRADNDEIRLRLAAALMLQGNPRPLLEGSREISRETYKDHLSVDRDRSLYRALHFVKIGAGPAAINELKAAYEGCLAASSSPNLADDVSSKCLDFMEPPVDFPADARGALAGALTTAFPGRAKVQFRHTRSKTGSLEKAPPQHLDESRLPRVLSGIRLFLWAVFSVALVRIARFDLRYKRIRNADLLMFACLMAAVYLGLGAHAVLGGASGWRYYLGAPFFWHAFIYAALSTAASAALWRLGVWPAGDAKLFSLLALVLPLIRAPDGFGALRMTFEVLSNIFIPAAVCLVVRAALYLAASRWRHGLYFLRDLGLRRLPAHVMTAGAPILAEVRAGLASAGNQGLRSPGKAIVSAGSWVGMALAMAVIASSLASWGMGGIAQGAACFFFSMAFSRLPAYARGAVSGAALLTSAGWATGFLARPEGLASFGWSFLLAACFGCFLFLGGKYALGLLRHEFLIPALPLFFFVFGLLPLGAWLAPTGPLVRGVAFWAAIGFAFGLGLVFVRAWDADCPDKVEAASLTPYMNLAPPMLAMIRQDQEFHGKYFRVVYPDGLSPEQVGALKQWCLSRSIAEVSLASTISFSGWIFLGYLIAQLPVGYVLGPFFAVR